MVKFGDIKYERPDYDKLRTKLQETIDLVNNSSNDKEITEAIREFNKKKEHAETMGCLALIRYYLDGTNESFSQEYMYCASQSESFDSSPLFEAIANNSYKKTFEKIYGTFLLEAEMKKAALHASGEEFVEEEQKALAECHKFVSKMLFDFDGEKISESRLGILANSDDSSIRKRARYARKKGYADNAEKIGAYLKRAVIARDKLAKANGFDNYLDYVNIRMKRFTYGEKELARFCENVKKYIIPLTAKNNEVIRKRLGLEKLTSDDNGIFFPDGNAKPKGDAKFVRGQAQKMFDDISTEFGDMYRRMNENDYFDIELSDTKVTGMGFAAEVYDLRISYIFGNFLGDADSVSTFLHENGHAIQQQLSMNKFDLMELYSQVQDLSEVPSKTMEQISYEYADLFFGDDAQKYIQGHITSVLNEIGNYCMFHEFETFVYTHPDAAIQEWIDKFNELSDIYNPGIEYVNPELREQGCVMCMNSNVFSFPRYLITYSLCDLSACYLAAEFNKNKERGAELFKKLGEIGGSKDYADSLGSLGLKPAYEEEVIKEIAEHLEDKLQLD